MASQCRAVCWTVQGSVLDRAGQCVVVIEWKGRLVQKSVTSSIKVLYCCTIVVLH